MRQRREQDDYELPALSHVDGSTLWCIQRPYGELNNAWHAPVLVADYNGLQKRAHAGRWSA